jgi:hypothetical protein
VIAILASVGSAAIAYVLTRDVAVLALASTYVTKFYLVFAGASFFVHLPKGRKVLWRTDDKWSPVFSKPYLFHFLEVCKEVSKIILIQYLCILSNKYLHWVAKFSAL